MSDSLDLSDFPGTLADVTDIWVLSASQGKFQVQVRTNDKTGMNPGWIEIKIFDTRPDAASYRDRVKAIVNVARRLAGKDRI